MVLVMTTSPAGGAATEAEARFRMEAAAKRAWGRVKTMINERTQANPPAKDWIRDKKGDKQ